MDRQSVTAASCTQESAEVCKSREGWRKMSHAAVPGVYRLCGFRFVGLGFTVDGPVPLGYGRQYDNPGVGPL